MKHLLPDLQEDFDRWTDLIGPDPYDGSVSLGIYDVLRAHYIIVDFFTKEFGEGIGGIGPKDLNMLHSALNRQFCGYAGKSKWNSDLQICATLFWGLIKNHAFHDVNKRTAFLSLLYHLRKIKRVPNARQKEFEILALRVASNGLDKYVRFKEFDNSTDGQVLFIADFLKRNTRPLDKNEYLVTYGDLNMILSKFNYKLDNPHKNKIDVIYLKQETRWKALKRVQETVEKRVGSIAFPGWTRQVPINEIKLVRKMTNLISEYGIDSESFFHDADPLNVLISQFSEPLKRLSDK